MRYPRGISWRLILINIMHVSSAGATLVTHFDQLYDTFLTPDEFLTIAFIQHYNVFLTPGGILAAHFDQHYNVFLVPAVDFWPILAA